MGVKGLSNHSSTFTKQFFSPICLVFLSLILVVVYCVFEKSTVVQTSHASEPVSRFSYIVVKYRERPEEGAGLRLANIMGGEGSISGNEFDTYQDVLDQVELNRQKFPERAARVPEGTIIPDLSLVRTIMVPTSKAEYFVDKIDDDTVVEYVDILETPEPTALPIDPYFSLTRPASEYVDDVWALRNIGLKTTDDGDTDSGWDITQGSSDIVIGVYGTGLDYTHPDLAANTWVNPGEDMDADGAVWDSDDMNSVDDDGNGYIDDLIGWNFGSNNNNVYDDGQSWGGHDTSVAGTIGATGNNLEGAPGVGWHFKMMPLKYGGYTQTLMYAVDNGASVMNYSWTGNGDGMKEYIDYAYANGLITVFSSANNNRELSYSSYLSDKVWIIGATVPGDVRASFSNYGDRLDFTAPGSSVWAPICTERSGSGLLTSFTIASGVDNLGNQNVAMFDPSHNVFQWGAETEGVWSFETIEEGSWAGIYPTIAYDTGNNPHVAYYDWDGYVLKYAVKSGGTWNIETLTASGDQGYHPSIKIGTDDLPRISYVDRTNSLLIYAEYTGTEWSFESVASVGTVSSSTSRTSLALTADNSPRIAYWKGDTQDLYYAKKVDGSWIVEAVDTTGTVGGSPALVLDASGDPYIAHSDTTNLDLRYSYWDGTWHSSTLLADGYHAYKDNDIALDTDGQPHIVTTSYVSSSWYLTYLKYDGAQWVTENIGASEVLGFYHDFNLVNDLPEIVSTSYKEGLFNATKGETWSIQKIADWGNPYSLWGGTSFSAPLASGLIGLMMSAHPDWTLDEIYWGVASTVADLGTPGFDKYYGWGRLNARDALYLDVPLVDEVEPTSIFTSPEDGTEIISGETVTLTGTADDENFTWYSVYYMPPTSQYWVMLKWYQRVPVIDDVLGSINTLGYTSGTFQVKLQVADFYRIKEEIITFDIITPDVVRPWLDISSVASVTSNPTLTFGGYASDDNSGVMSVEYQMDGTSGSWTACRPNDGAFDSRFEYFTCGPGRRYASGTHTVYFRCFDVRGNQTDDGMTEVLTFNYEYRPVQWRFWRWLRIRWRPGQ